MLGLPKETPYRDLIRIWRERIKKPVKPVVLDKGPCKENILKGKDVDLFQPIRSIAGISDFTSARFPGHISQQTGLPLLSMTAPTTI
jgi:hypothetical protein